MPPLRTSDDFLVWKRLVDNMPAIVWTARPEGGIEFMSRQFAAVVGVDPEAAYGTSWMSLIHPEDRDAYLEARRIAIERGSTFRCRARFRVASGEFRWFESQAEPVRNDDGAIVRVFGTSLDIDDVVRIERELKAQNERSEALLGRWQRFRDSNIIGLGIADIDGRLIEANHALNAMLGYDETPASWQAITPPGWEEADARAVAELQASGYAAPFEKEYLASDGRRVPVLIGCSTLPEDPSRVTFYCIDLSERRRTETVMRVLAEREWLSSASDENGVAQQFVDFAIEVKLADVAIISLSDPGGPLVVATSAARDGTIARRLAALAGRLVPENSSIARAAASGISELLHVDEERIDAIEDDEFRALVRRIDPGSLLEVPLLGGARTLGVATLVRLRTSAPYAQYELELANFVAKRAALALENVRLRSVERRSKERWELLAQEAEALTASLEFDEIADDVARRIVPRIADGVTIHTLTEQGRFRTAATAHGDPAIDAAMRAWRGTYLRGDEREWIRDSFATKRTIALSLDEQLAPHPRERADGGPVHVDARAGGYHHLFAPLVARGRTLGVLICWRMDRKRPFDADELAFVEEYARRAALAFENALAFERERRVSESFQHAALPARLPDVPGARLDAVYVAGSSEATVGGDWYDAVRLLDGRIMLSIGDVAGSGLQAAVTMNAIRQVLRGVALIVPDPDLMLEAADRAMRADGESYATALVALYDPIARTLQCATAGHAPPVLRRADGSIADVPAGSGPPLGLRTSENVAAATPPIELAAGDVVTLYTDGLTEAKRDLQDGERRVREAIASPGFGAREKPAEWLLHAVLADPSRDDVAIVSLRMLDAALDGAMGETRWRIDSLDPDDVRRVRREIRALLEAAGWDAAALSRAELVAGELLANTVRHAPGAVDVVFEPGTNPVLHVIDDGPGVDAKPRPVRDELSESGRGLAIVTATTASFSISAMPGRGSHARAVLLSGNI